MKCAKCSLELSVKAFNPRKHHSGNMGYDAWCRSCRSLYRKQYEIDHPRPKHLRSRLTLEQKRTKNRERYKNNLKYKMSLTLRKAVHDAIARHERSQHTLELLGCSVEYLKVHLEALFQPGMTWDGWSQYGWHIDHKKPISSFDLTDPEQQKLCFHYTNLQPLWWRDNLAKGNKIL